MHKYRRDYEIIDELKRMPETCCLDVADRGAARLDEVGVVLGITRERVRQIEGLPGKTGGALGMRKILRIPRLRKMMEGCL